MLKTFLYDRKLTGFILLVFVAINTSKAQKFHVGVLGGTTVSSSTVKEYKRTYYFSSLSGDLRYIISTTKIKPLISFFGGIRTDYELSNSISLSSGLVLENIGFISKINDRVSGRVNGIQFEDSVVGKDYTRLLYLSIPLHFVFYAPLQKSRLFVGVGGFGSYGLGGTSHFKKDFSYNNGYVIEDSIVYVTFNNSRKVKYAAYHASRYDYGLSVIGGIEFRNNLFLEISYQSGLITILKDRFVAGSTGSTSHNFSNKRRVFKAGIGFRLK